jgi:hypothetical protein
MKIVDSILLVEGEGLNCYDCCFYRHEKACPYIAQRICNGNLNDIISRVWMTGEKIDKFKNKPKKEKGE